MGGDAFSPEFSLEGRIPPPNERNPDPDSETLLTFNPAAEQITFQGSDRLVPIEPDPAETARLIQRLESYGDIDDPQSEMTLSQVVAFAFAHSREYRFAEEEYVLAGLRLLIERHLWGPRFFNDTSFGVAGEGDDGMFDTAAELVNEFRVTQRLPYGGDVSARVLARATEDLHATVAGEGVQSADVILEAEIPILRGAGVAARDPRIQEERNLIYAAREFERFRREFFFDITSDFLDLVVRRQGIQNAMEQVASLQALTEREYERYHAGRIDLNQYALAQQRAFDAQDSLNSQLESYRLAVDRFKVRLGMPTDRPLSVAISTPGLPVPEIDLAEAVRLAMTYRLDLQTRRDQVQDARSRIEIARNDLLPDLDFTALVDVPTDDDRRRAGVDFEPRDSIFSAGVTFGLPLDREIERLGLRDSQISYERSIRAYEEFADNLAVTVRSAVRDIDRTLFTLQIQTQGIINSQNRLDSIEEVPDRFSARDKTEAIEDLNSAKDQYDQAYRDLQIAILRYLLETDQLRVLPGGGIRPLEGMEVDPDATTPRRQIEEYLRRRDPSEYAPFVEPLEEELKPEEGSPEAEESAPAGSEDGEVEPPAGPPAEEEDEPDA